MLATLGRPEVLRETLATVARCDPPPYEVIVVDGDPGGSAEAVAAGARYARSAPGLTRQRNAGLDLAEGEVVVFVDDDTNVAPDLFAALADGYRRPDVVGATGRVVDRDLRRFGNMRSRWRRLLPGGGEEGGFTRAGYPRRVQDETRERDVETMLGGLMSARRELAARVRFDERLTGYSYLEDEDFAYRLSRLGRIRFLPAAQVEHRNVGADAKRARARDFNRTAVVNRAYLFRKNFSPTPLARAQFVLLVGVLIVHRAINGEWAGVRGLLDGSLEAWRRRGERPGAPGPTDAVPVSFVISHALRGGSERYLELLLERLEPAWVRSVVSLQSGPFVDRLRELGHRVDVVETGARLSMLPAALRVRRLLRSARPAVVHANGVKAALVTVLGAPGIPVVWVKHDFSWDGPLARLVAARCDQVVGVSAAVVASLEGRARTHVVHNGIPALARDRGAGRALVERLVPGAQAVVLLVGRFHPAKGQVELVEAAPLALARRPDTRFLLLGGDDPYQLDYARRVRARIEELGLGESVAIGAHHDDAPAVIAGCDLVAMPSMPDERGMGREGFGLVGLEAMAVGTPVVGYAGGALPEVLGDAAELVPEGDRAALAQAIVALLDDPARRAELAERGRERVERFSLDATVAGMRARYSEAAGSG